MQLAIFGGKPPLTSKLQNKLSLTTYPVNGYKAVGDEIGDDGSYEHRDPDMLDMVAMGIRIFVLFRRESRQDTNSTYAYGISDTNFRFLGI